MLVLVGGGWLCTVGRRHAGSLIYNAAWAVLDLMVRSVYWHRARAGWTGALGVGAGEFPREWVNERLLVL